MYTTKLYFDGKNPSIQNKPNLIEFLSKFGNDNWFEVTINPIGSVNSSNQQRLYFTWCDIIAQEFGWDSGQEVHEFCKTRYNSGKSTKSFDTKQWSEYMIKVQAFAAESNIILPTGNS